MTRYNLKKSGVAREVDIELHKESSRIGIFVSGGLDSTVLFYALLLEREKDKRDIDFTALTVSKVAADIYSKPIIAKLSEKFGPIKHITGLDNEGAIPGTITPAIQRQLHAHQFDYIYTGINSNPPSDKFYSQWGVFPNRPTASPHSSLILPFLSLYKSHIIELAYLLDIQDLISLTHSCTEKTVGRCQVCFACDERKWGFQENNKTDPGQL